MDDLREKVARPSFGDVVENGWASEDNPTRRGFFVREFVRNGRLNPGRTWEITDGRGKFWEFKPSDIGERLTVTPTALDLIGGDGWRPAGTEPSACTVIATRFDDCEWAYAVVETPLVRPFTHWRPLPPAPAQEPKP